ncbi:immune-associated nucleotide-binding protein 9-like [Phalaenopsis equestris]|uniref:immune-associated nucleotide-binding protein 9-like n=1 Tax=Phalaenopsis equestris TaxID=78828 RepID=UPI0009E56935|nr:immune-associated nucleotide-binding protein 9-like [Phalaenopsis equestris]XP_020581623.1 immune-associated nucleotide-binding protein 9-like [Phalaenopsis equestris]
MEDDLINLPENWEGAPIFFNDVFLAVVGKLGNGKSSVANSILGKRAFISDDGVHMITHASKMKSTILKDGRHVHVIDTPGLVNFSASPEFVGREIEKCIDLAKDGLHDVLMVFTMCARFTKEEENAIRYLKIFFGDKIVEYLIVVLVGGDVLEKKKITFSEWIKDCPEPLKNLILLCNRRVVIFDNITKDEVKRERQVKRLISLNDFIVANNGGKLFTRQMFAEAKEGALCRQQKQKENKDNPECSTKHLSKQKEKLDKSFDDEFIGTSEVVHRDLYEKIQKLETNLRQEKASRLKLEEDGKTSIQELQKAMEISDEKIRELKAELESKCECVIL